MSTLNVLLLHGMGAGASSWDPLAAMVSPQLRLWRVTLPWSVTGDGSWARETDVTQWIAGPISHIGQRTGRAPDLIVAHSFAANVLLELLTLAQPPIPSAVVLISPFYPPIGTPIEWIAGMTACYAHGAKRIRRRRGGQGDAVTEAVIRKLLEAMGEHAPLRFYEACRRTPQLNLEAMTNPMLLVGGEADEFGAHPDGVRELGARIPHARVEILEGCGHFVMTERSAELAALLANLVEEVPR